MHEPALPIPIYSIYDRDIPLTHLRVCVIVNPIGRGPKDNREKHEKRVAGCEVASCSLASSPEGKSQSGDMRPTHG
jgi:hypothetical protein